jgi:sugar phosphate isomerase/epimerase
MDLSLTTDYIDSSGDPEPRLAAIADAGFSHVHWCHEWNTDKLYSPGEIADVGSWLKEFGLCLLDLHASEGREVSWGAIDEGKRRAGAALVANRMEMTAALGGDVIVLHIPFFENLKHGGWLDPIRRSLDELEPLHRKLGVRIALENTGSDDNWSKLNAVFSGYPAEFVGLCYDSGHGNFNAPSVDNLRSLTGRLVAIHLHDNDGSGDQHLLPFRGTVDWPLIMGIIAQSSYRKCVSLEVGMKNFKEVDEKAFLSEAFAAGKKLTGMIAEAKRFV